MKLLPLAPLVLLGLSPLSAMDEPAEAQGPNVFQQVLEAKYQTSLERLRVLDYSETTKVLGYDFELSGDKSWWGGINVVEVDREGKPIFWHDIPQPPTESGIERLRLVEFSGHKFLEVIGCSHKGNGTLYLYELRSGGLHLLVQCRVMTNLLAMHFSPTIANIQYRDVDKDGDQDLIIKADCLKGPIIEKSRQIIGHYRRVFHYENGAFVEKINKRDGAPMLMD